MASNDATIVKIVLADTELSTWIRYEIESDFLRPANAFSLTASNREAELAGQVLPGDECKVIVDDTVQMAGYVDEVNYSVGEQGSMVEITGRDRFGQLMDNSAPLLSLKKRTLKQICEQLTSNWIDSWESDITLSQISRIKIEPGETIMNVISRLAKKEDALIWLDPDGTGHIGRPNYSQSPLYQLICRKKSNPNSKRNNIISGSMRTSWTDRYSSITVHGTTGNTAANYATSSRYRGIATDDQIQQNRSLIMSDGDIKNVAQAKARAELEVARREFDAITWDYTVRGHYGELPDGKGGKKESLWEINTIVDVDDEFSETNAPCWVLRRRFRGDDSGRYTDLELRAPDVWMSGWTPPEGTADTAYEKRQKYLAYLRVKALNPGIGVGGS